MRLIDKARILSEFSALRDDDAWVEFFDAHDEGITLGALVSSGRIVELKEDDERRIIDAYAALLSEWGVVDAEYSSLTDLVAGQPDEEHA